MRLVKRIALGLLAAALTWAVVSFFVAIGHIIHMIKVLT